MIAQGEFQGIVDSLSACLNSRAHFWGRGTATKPELICSAALRKGEKVKAVTLTSVV